MENKEKVPENKNVLILTADAGFGHRSAANAILEALNEQYGDRVKADIVNPLDEPTAPNFLRESQSDYDRWIRNVPELYRFGYEATDSPVPSAILERSLALLLAETMRELMIRYKPDLVVSTYPSYQAPLLSYLQLKRSRMPIFTVVTDLSSVHRLWFHRKIDGCLVPNEHVAELAMDYGIPPSKVTITGIPVSPSILHETREKNEIRKELGWNPDIPTILAVGSNRVERLLDTLNVINHFSCGMQVAVIAGKNEKFSKDISEFEWHIPVHIYDFVENMPTLMKASDLLVCKAGGLIVTESLASGLPMMLIEVIPGQETGNAEYVIAYGAADMAQSPIEVLELLSHLMKDNQSLLKKRAANATMLGKPRSAIDTATVLWKAIESNSNKIVTPRHRRSRPEGPPPS